MSGANRSILVASSDRPWLELLKTSPRTAVVPLVAASTGKDAQLALADVKNNYLAIFVHLGISEPGARSVIRAARAHRPSTPVIALKTEQLGLTAAEQTEMGLREMISSPGTYEELIERVLPKAHLFDAQAVTKLGAAVQNEVLDREFAGEDVAYAPVAAKDFLSGTTSFFDLYVRLGSGKYIKIIKSGEAFSPDRLQNYLAKGVTHFYLRQEAYEHYVAYVDRIAMGAVKAKGISQEARTQRVLAHGQEAMGFLTKQGLSHNQLHYADRFVTNTRALVEGMNLEKDESVKALFANLAQYDHAVSTSMIACLVAAELGIDSEKCVRMVGVAALLHDVGLYRLPEKLHNEVEEGLTSEEVGLYQTHPHLGGLVLAQTGKGVDLVSIQAVQRHHERRGKKGFPQRQPGTPSHQVAEIVGLSDELARLIKRAVTDPKLSIPKELEFVVFHGFSFPVCAAFKKLFLAGET